jgi:very-short-patch-repair endonuclease
MRGGALTLPFIRSPRTGFPLTFLWLGRILKGELIEHEVRIGRYYADFATPRSRFLKAIEIDGAAYHSQRMDIVADQEREDYLRERGWQVFRIPARRLWREPRRVYIETLRFLRS